MKVFVVCAHNVGTPESNEVQGVFKSNAKAIAWCKTECNWLREDIEDEQDFLDEVFEHNYYIEEYEVA